MSVDTLSFDRHAADVPQARRHVMAALRRAGVGDDTIDTAALLTSELATNAVLHGAGQLQVTVVTTALITNGVVRVAVRDGGDRRPMRREHPEDSVLGRGLQLVESLATGFGVHSHNDGGKTVWFELGGEQPERSWELEEDRPTTTLELRNLPVPLYEVARLYNEALLRDYALYLLAADDADGVSVSEISVIDRVRVAISNVFDGVVAADAAASVATARRLSRADVQVEVRSRDLAVAGRRIRAAFDHAEALAAQGMLLTPPAPLEVADLRAWFVDQIERQAGGGLPAPWTDRRTPAANQEVTSKATTESAYELLRGHRWAIAAGVGDRIIALTSDAAELLGWQPDDLVGRPLTTIIPPELREPHVAAFARQVLTGAVTILDTSVAVDAWHRDGIRVPITLVLHRDHSGRDIVYVAVITPRA